MNLLWNVIIGMLDKLLHMLQIVTQKMLSEYIQEESLMSSKEAWHLKKSHFTFLQHFKGLLNFCDGKE